MLYFHDRYGVVELTSFSMVVARLLKRVWYSSNPRTLTLGIPSGVYNGWVVLDAFSADCESIALLVVGEVSIVMTTNGDKR